MKKVSLETIAKKLNVSAVTVHKALKNQQGVSDKLRLQIINLANELGYESPAPPILNNYVHIIHKKFLLGADEQFYTPIYYYLSQECTKRNGKMYLIVHDTVAVTIQNLKTLFNETSIDGIFISGQIEKELLTEIEKFRKTVVCIDFFSSDFKFNYVYVDNYYAGYTLAKYLIRLGHRRLCFIGDISFSDAIADRYFGCLRALNKFRISEPCLHINTNIEREQNLTELDLPSSPTAFICHCDRAASILYNHLKMKGLNIPNDVSVISFDNTDLCNLLSPSLTSVGIEKEAFATQAFSMMQQALQGKTHNLNYIKLNLSIYERDSVKSLNQPSV